MEGPEIEAEVIASQLVEPLDDKNKEKREDGEEGKNKRRRNSKPLSAEITDARRESHKIIEQKRRQKINEKINELRELLNYPDGSQNKAVVLQAAVDNIKNLKVVCSKLLSHHRQLQDEYMHLLAENERLRKITYAATNNALTGAASSGASGTGSQSMAGNPNISPSPQGQLVPQNPGDKSGSSPGNTGLTPELLSLTMKHNHPSFSSQMDMMGRHNQMQPSDTNQLISYLPYDVDLANMQLGPLHHHSHHPLLQTHHQYPSTFIPNSQPPPSRNYPSSSPTSMSSLNMPPTIPTQTLLSGTFPMYPSLSQSQLNLATSSQHHHNPSGPNSNNQTSPSGSSDNPISALLSTTSSPSPNNSGNNNTSGSNTNPHSTNTNGNNNSTNNTNTTTNNNPSPENSNTSHESNGNHYGGSHEANVTSNATEHPSTEHENNSAISRLLFSER